MEIAKTLVLSTAHVTKKTAILLDGEHRLNWPSNGGRYGEYGWFFYAPPERPQDMPEDMWAICQVARAVDCPYILLDRDGPTFEHLDTHSW